MRFLCSLVLVSAICYAQKFNGFDATSLDKSGDPCVDFYQYACGGWMAANPIPSDQSRWGRFNALQERNRAVLQGILEAASSAKPGRSVTEREIGDYYAACMDEKAIDARGIAPLKDDLDRINAMRDKAAITDVVIHLYRIGSQPFFHFSLVAGREGFDADDRRSGSGRAGTAGARLLSEGRREFGGASQEIFRCTCRGCSS